MRDGQKVFCRKRQAPGSRMPDVMVCGTVAQLREEIQESREVTDRAERIQVNSPH